MSSSPPDGIGAIPPERKPTERDGLREECLHHLFEKQAERTPDAVAVVHEGRELTFRELNKQSDRLAHQLCAMGVGPEVLVGVCLDRSPEMVVALLGILKAGGAFLPLDPGYPADRLALILDISRNPLVLRSRSGRPVDLPLHSNLIHIEDLEEASLEAAVSNNLPDSITCESLCYVLFTSGSTGRPKGVMVNHRSIVNHMVWMQARFPVSPWDTVLQKTPISFDAAVWEVFLPLMSGARMALAVQDGHRDPGYLVGFIRQERVTIAQFVPSLLEWFVDHPQVSGCKSLRRLFSGGEALPLALCDRIFQRLDVELVNLYGPTEATIDASYWVCQPIGSTAVAPIGKPVSNTCLHVLNSRLQPVDIGVVGELFIGGAQVARGYLNAPDLTAERFISDPFSSNPEDRLYQTGDLARWRPDGDLEFLGRSDHQVKIRGHRIELGEIEAVLAGHSGIVSCAVISRDEEASGKTIVAFVVAREDIDLTIGSLREWLEKKLPAFMIPSRFLALPVLPLTPNDKLDRKALENLDGTDLGTGGTPVPAGNELETRLVEIWQAALHRDSVGIHDHFLDLGGHSLLALSLCSRISQDLNLVVPMRWIFEFPTIAALAGKIETSGTPSHGHHRIERADRNQPLPMSFAQQRMWLMDRMLPDPAAYNEPVAYQITGPVDQVKVRRALQRLMERHEVLRTALILEGEDLLQRIEAPERVSLQWVEIDLEHLPPEGRHEAAAARMLDEARQPFDLALAPLWRVVWIRMAADEQVFGLVFHHSIVDDWSFRLFIGEFEKLHAADEAPESAGLVELPVQYADFSVWQRRQMTGEAIKKHRNHWSEQLRDFSSDLNLPTDLARPVQPSGQGEIHGFQVKGPLSTGLLEMARADGCSLFTVMMAAFHVWLYRYTGQTDLIVGTPVANRGQPEVQDVFGFFLNTLPIRVRLDGLSGFRQVLRDVSGTLLAAFDHSDLPFEQIVELSTKDRSTGQQPLYQAMFVLLEKGPPPLRLGRAAIRTFPTTTKTSKNDLILSIDAVGLEWECRFEYSTDLFRPATVARMAAHFVELLRSIVARPDMAIARLNLMEPAERQRLLVEWNQTQREYPRDQCIHNLFADQVRQSPDAVALELGGARMTYGELNRQSDQIARKLADFGVKPGDLVAMDVERSFERVIGLLAILKAGAAYWALEENLPEERLCHLINDAKPKLVLTSSGDCGKLVTFANVVAIRELLASLPDPGVFVGPEVSPADPAYVSYTSGSTGRPKGVVVPHRGVVRLVKGADYAALTSAETLIHLSPLSFDASTFELWGALLNGGRLVLLPPGVPSPAEIGAAIERHGVTTMWLTAGLFHLMVDEKLEDLKPLRQLLAGGDVLDPVRVAKARDALPTCRIINGYGPTENTTFTCCFTVSKEMDLTPSVPIGRPIANTRVYILNPYLEPVPVGVEGELFAAGDGLACGYLNQPELTAERFLPDPFNPEEGARLYRTGDRVRWRTDGNIEFLGRTDFQVKIRGFRVELGEIETALRARPGVREAVVLWRPDAHGGHFLVGYLVLAAPAAFSADGMRRDLLERLPDYMVPAAFVVLDELPLLPNGKLNRRVLPAPEAISPGPDKVSSPPKNLLEHSLIRIWMELFHRQDIGRSDHFFDLGGHSLLAARLVAEIEKLTGIKLPIAALLESPTIETLALRLTEATSVPARRSLVPLQANGSKPPLFLVHGWGGDVYGFLDLAKAMAPDQPVYGIQAVGLDGKRERHTSVESMATHYVREIRSFQPEGPYFLGGYSLGGLFAFEVALQLTRLDQRVALLALIETEPIGGLPWPLYARTMIRQLCERSVFHLKRFQQMPSGERFDYFVSRWRVVRSWIGRNQSKPLMAKEPQMIKSQAPQPAAAEDYYHALTSTYRLQRYHGAIDFFAGDDADPYDAMCWRNVARVGFTLHRVHGNHFQILDPSHVESMATALRSALDRKES